MTYATVTWQPDDEATSQKMQQMADNDTWMHDNMLSGPMIWREGVNGQPTSRTPATYVATKMAGLYVPFTSGTANNHFDLRVDYPPLFTKPPIIVATIGNGTPDYLALCVTITFLNSTEYAMLKVFHRTGNSMVLSGSVNVLLFGV